MILDIKEFIVKKQFWAANYLSELNYLTPQNKMFIDE